MEDTGLVLVREPLVLLVLQRHHYRQVRTYCQVEALQVLRGLHSIQAWEALQGHKCSQEGRDHLHHYQVVPGIQGDLAVWLRPSLLEEPDQGVAAGFGGFGWSRPFEQASSGSGVAATEKERGINFNKSI